MTRFGVTKAGDAVEAITLSAHGLSATILTYGAIVQDVRLDGIAHSLTIGSDRLDDYENDMRYYGCVVAPVANRLRDASATIDGVKHQFEANQHGKHTLHSGTNGAHAFVWQIDDKSQNCLFLSHKMTDVHGGFPANRTITARFEITAGPTLRLTLTTTTDAPSIANATNHSYWNLDGSGKIAGHQIRVDADHYLPTDDVDSLVTGEVRPVAGTDYDFRSFAPLVPENPPLDHTFCVAPEQRDLTECMFLTGASGLSMTVATTEAGVHIYDARDAQYPGIAIEAQGWPDAPNQPDFPSIEVTPDAPVVQITEWRFAKP